MARDDDSFWIAIFRKSPLIASFMAIGGLAGAGIGGVYFSELMHFLRLYLCILLSSGLAGIALGLIVGVSLDSLVGVFRNKNEGDQERKRRSSR